MEPLIQPDPDDDVLELLAAIFAFLSERGIAMEENGYDEAALAAALAALGWTWGRTAEPLGDPSDEWFAVRRHQEPDPAGVPGNDLTGFVVRIPASTIPDGSGVEPTVLALALALRTVIRANEGQPPWAETSAEWQLPPRPALRELVRVVPIARSIRGGQVTVTYFSLDAYADGAVLRSKLRVAPDHPMLGASRRPGEPNWPHTIPEVVLEARDDRDHRYRCHLDRGSGDDDGWEMSEIVEPALDPRARELVLEVTLGWRRVGGRRRDRERVTTEFGPVTFVVDLTRGLAATELTAGG